MRRTQNGSVLVYILIAVGLFAAISYAVSRDGSSGQSTTQLSEAQAQLLASRLVAQAAAAQMAVDQMNDWGISPDQILFDMPSEAVYSSNTSRQIYHPSGGGLNFQIPDIKNALIPEYFFGWNWKNTTNVEWSPTSEQDDLIFTYLNLTRPICEQINEKILGTKDMPQVDRWFNFGTHFDGDNATSADFFVWECPDCEGLKSACVQRLVGGHQEYYAFYNILSSR